MLRGDAGQKPREEYQTQEHFRSGFGPHESWAQAYPMGRLASSHLYAVGIQIAGMLGNQMVIMCLVLEWSDFLMAG